MESLLEVRQFKRRMVLKYSKPRFLKKPRILILMRMTKREMKMFPMMSYEGGNFQQLFIY